MVIDGKKIAEEIIENLKKQPKSKKFLSAFLVGENPASVSFLKQKETVAKELEIDFRLYRFPNSITQDELRKEVLKIANHKTCGGVIVQLPLPEPINRYYVCNVIPREKDVDVLGERALGAFYTGRNKVLPPAAGVLEKILQVTGYSLQDAKVAVVGLGFLVGKPIATWLTRLASDESKRVGKVSELYLLDKGSDLTSPEGKLKEADIVISGVGKSGLINSEMLKNNAIVIDFGYSMIDGKVHGDFNASALDPNRHTLTYTPTPGGTGPVLVAQLFENFYRLNS